ncbi:LytTR family transcriptional regulator DNA-binding domain-containing protein [Paenibacillus montanisoli]|uniref:HTH LytTR-type domain-containing protein n=1 Tax=Paenibacillus montanisoli TaxID=2081970 RepID=A0A328TY88_9BACL|nr:LytTR family transcriptional regulator DNA-binding domain-containing protein [Paenibacillus montanisoli]RAP75448.1 hypothetical protein DL346_19060 [Paenibacillus montanisoli]
MKMLLLNEKGLPETVGVREILFINQTKKGPEFVTGSGVYRFPLTMEQLYGVFHLYGFEQLDRNAIVNLEHVQRYDPTNRTVYFETEEAGGSTIYATVSATNAAKVKHLIRDGGIEAEEKEEEYFLLYKLKRLFGIGIV